VRDSFELVLKMNPEDAGETTEVRRFACGDTIIIDAVSQGCYYFLNWSDANQNNITNQPIHKIILKGDSTLTANFQEIISIVRWDSLKSGVRPNDTISLIATIENVDIPITFTHLYFSIWMDYKLFYPLKLFVVDDQNREQSLSFNYKFPDGVSSTITNFQIAPVSSRRFLRLEWLALASHTTETPIFFNEFNVKIDKEYCVFHSTGFLNVPYCASEQRGSIVFMPVFDVPAIENIVTDELKIDINATGELPINIEIIDIDGSTLLAQQSNLPKGNSILQIKLTNIASVKYFVRFSNPFNTTVTRQFIKL
jgi:hypothetical protein